MSIIETEDVKPPDFKLLFLKLLSVIFVVCNWVFIVMIGLCHKGCGTSEWSQWLAFVNVLFPVIFGTLTMVRPPLFTKEKTYYWLKVMVIFQAVSTIIHFSFIMLSGLY